MSTIPNHPSGSYTTRLNDPYYQIDKYGSSYNTSYTNSPYNDAQLRTLYAEQVRTYRVSTEHIHADLMVTDSLTVSGKNIFAAIEKLEHMIGIVQTNPKLEEKYAKLKELGDRYRLLEQECLGKEKVLDALKK